MYTLYKTRAFIDWLDRLKDDKAVALINRRLLMLAKHEHFGDAKQVAKGITEMRISCRSRLPGVSDPARQADHPAAVRRRQAVAEA